MSKRIITISREFGSGGRTIGKMVAEKLGIAFYDKELIEKIAEETGFSQKFIEEYGEHAPGTNVLSYSFLGRDANGISMQDKIWMQQRKLILDLAENLIKLSGYIPYVDIDIVETGLRPGEKLYEELLMKSDGLMKTTSSKIFIERQTEISQTEMNHKLEILHEALEQGGREAVRLAMKQVVPTFRDPDEVNREVTALENSESEKK